MNVRIFGAGALLAVGLAAGCGTSSEPMERSGKLHAAIQGGTTDTTHTYAVGLSARGGTCSGTLIAPNLVLTARHCVASLPSGERVDCATARFGANFGGSEVRYTAGTTIPRDTRTLPTASRVITPPGSNMVCGNDIALLILSTNVAGTAATPATPAVQYPVTDHDLYGYLYTAIGYGLTSANSVDTSGTRRILQNIGLSCIPNDPALDCYTPPTGDPGAKDLLTPNEFAGGNGTCQGDSGSGAYDQNGFNAGKPNVLGVLSRGGADNAGNCVGAIYTRVDVYRDWIVSVVKEAAQLGGYPVPAWTQPGPARPDAGTGTDSGTKPDSGKTEPKPGELGHTCGGDEECDTGHCAAIDGETFICTEPCEAASDTCAEGYACQGGYCFPGEKKDPSKSGNNVTTTQQSGCAVSTDPGQPIPWHWLGLGAGAMILMARRRRGSN